MCVQKEVCDVSPEACEKRSKRSHLAKELFGSVKNTEETENGYLFEYLFEEPVLQQIMQFINTEPRCCPFFRFHLDVKPEDNRILFQLTGDKEVKSFLESSKFFPV